MEQNTDKFIEDTHHYSYIKRLLLAIDQFFNVLLWNGSHNETISGHIGRKIKAGTANKFEKMICWGLRKIESKHCIEAIGE